MRGGLVLAAAGWFLTSTVLTPSPGIAAGGRPADGRGLFWGLNKLMALLVWLLAPTLTADCLAREKRDGTLGLLFLTPLRGVDVVVGKAASHTLRALMVLVAAYPILMLPVLLGGVGWADGLRMFLLQLAVLGLALAAGVTASALTRDWLRARLLALLLTAAASFIFAIIYVGSWTVWRTSQAGPKGVKLAVPTGVVHLGGTDADSFWTIFSNSLEGWVFGQIYQLSSPVWFWRGGNSPSTSTAILLAFGVLALCWSLVWLAVELAAMGLVKTWQRDAAPPPPNRATTALTRDRFALNWRRRRRQRLLDRNPIAWLHDAKWTARLGKWVWCGWAGIVLVIAVSSYPQTEFANRVMNLFLIPLIVAVAFSAAASFRKERESGALEILLVTPLTPQAMLRGRLRGLAGTFGPALLILTLALLWGVVGQISTGLLFIGDHIWEAGISGLSLWAGPAGVALLGLSFGLRSHGVLNAALWALGHWYLIPYAAAGAIVLVGGNIWGTWDSEPNLAWWPFVGAVAGTRIWLAWRAWRMGERALAQRLFLPKPKELGVDVA